MARCPRCGGSFFYDAIEREHRCLNCGRSRDRVVDPLPLLRYHTEERRAHRAPRPTLSPPGYRCLRAIAATTGLTKETLCMRLHARGIPSQRGANRTTLVAEGDVAALVLRATEWRERGRVG